METSTRAWYKCTSVRFSLVTGIVLMWGAVATSVWADQSLHATAELSTGFSSNVLGVPDTSETQIEADAFATIAPGALFTYEVPRSQVQVRYLLSARLFARRQEANSFSNSLNVRGSFALDPRSTIEASLTGSAGRVNAFDSRPADAPIGQTPNGDLAYARALWSLGYSNQLSPVLRTRLITAGSAFTPTDETTSVRTNWNTNLVSTLERSWKHHELTGQLQARYVHNERVSTETGNRLTPDLQIHLGPQLRWLWDISGAFSSAVAVGVVRVFAPDDFNRGLYQPNLSVQVSYLRARSVLTMRLLHGVTTNSLVGQSSTIDRAELRGYYPLNDWIKDAGLSGTIAYQHAQFIDVQSSRLAASSDQTGFDLAASWKQSDGLVWALRYRYSMQTRGQAVLGAIGDTSRHQVTIGLSIRYPDRQALELPTQINERVDRGGEGEFAPDAAGGRR